MFRYTAQAGYMLAAAGSIATRVFRSIPKACLDQHVFRQLAGRRTASGEGELDKLGAGLDAMLLST
jgi:hypothetical protein